MAESTVMGFLVKLLQIGTRRRGWTLFFMVLVSIVTGLGLPHLRIETNLASLAGDNAPDRPLYDEVVQKFGSDKKILLYLRSPDLWQAEKLARLRDIHQDLEKLSFVTKVDSLLNAQTIRFSEGALYSGPLFPPDLNDPFTIARSRENTLHNPLLAGQILSDDGLAMAMIIHYEEQKWNKQFDHNSYLAVEEVVERNRPHFQEIFQVGSPRLGEELKRNIVDDLLLLAPISGVVLAIAITLLMGSLFAAVLPVLTSLTSLLWTFGIMGWFGIPINVLTAMLPSLVLVMGSTEDIHMFSAYLNEMSRDKGQNRLEVVRRMLRQMGLPLLLTITTTCLGFFSNILNDIEMIRDFALSATLALFINGVVSLLIIPMVLSFVGPTHARFMGERGEIQGVAGFIIRFFDRIIHHHSRVTLSVTAGIVLFFLYHTKTLHVTNDPLSYFTADQPLVVHTERIHEDFSGVKTFFVHLQANAAGAFKDPTNIVRLKKIQDWLDRQGMHDSSQSLADLLSLLNREFHKGQAAYFTVPDSQPLVEQYLLFLSREQLTPFVDKNFSSANIIVRHNINDSHDLNELVRNLRAEAPLIAGSGIAVSVLGENLMINAAADHLIVAQIQSLGLLLLVIFIFMSLLFTSVKGGLISLVPNLIPIIMVFGMMGWMGLPINPGTAMVAVIAIGIAVDDTIHLLFRYMEECRRNVSREQAVRQTIHDEAIPVISTSLALIAGFLVLSFSHFSIIAQFGQLSAATLFFALLADLLVTPIFMRRIRLVGFAQILALEVRREVVENSPLFCDMSLFEVKKTILISELKRFKTGDLIIRQGSVGKSLGLILSGSVEVLIQKEGENTLTQVAVLTPGQIFGEIGFIRATRRVSNIQALEPVEILVFDFEQLQQEMKFFPQINAKLNLNISRILGRRLAEVLARKS